MSDPSIQAPTNDATKTSGATKAARCEEERSIGAHRLQLKPPDLARVQWNGSISGDEMREVLDVTHTWLGPKGSVFAVANLAKLGEIPIEVRRVVASHPRAKRIAAIAFINATFQLRVLLTMMQKAVDLLHPTRGTRVGFFDDEASALAWLDGERERASLP